MTEEDAEGDTKDETKKDAQEDPEINLTQLSIAILTLFCRSVFFMFPGAVILLDIIMKGIDT